MIFKFLRTEIKNKTVLRTSVVICAFLFVMIIYTSYIRQSLFTIPNSVIIASTTVQQPNSIIAHLQKLPEHHTELETHRYQMKLSVSRDFEELHKLMARQYDVKHGLYEGKPYKKILYWNRSYTLPNAKLNSNFGVGVGRDRYKLAGCPVWQCETSENRTDVLEYDAIIFNSCGANGRAIPEKRSPHQRYIFFSYESPLTVPEWQFSDLNSFPPGFFNWTMTYRWDSDVVHPYVWIEPIDENVVPMHPTQEVYKQSMESFLLSLKDMNVNYAAGKTKMILSFASSCNTKSRREKVMEALSKMIPVDNYGHCLNNLTCGRKADYNRPMQVEEECLSEKTKDYKFFLSFHNSLCQDYIAERFGNALRYPVIPIVYDAHGHHAKMAPPHSFINVLDFPSIPALAKYLMILDKNDTLYNEYFWWRSHYRVRNGQFYEGMHLKNFCSVCAALHNPNLHANEKPNNQQRIIQDWWYNNANCKQIGLDGLFTMDYSVAKLNKLY